VFPIADRVIEVADRIGKTPAQVSLAWVLSKPGVVAPIVGASKVEQIRQLIEAADITLDAADIAYLEAPYQPVENLLSIGYS